MNDQEDFHKHAAIEDKIRLVGELEHIRAHAIKSALVKKHEMANASSDKEAGEIEEEVYRFVVYAQEAKKLRRELMSDHFSKIPDEYWCLCKASASMAQVAQELSDLKCELLDDLVGLQTRIWSEALGIDLTGCKSCQEDRQLEGEKDA